MSADLERDLMTALSLLPTCSVRWKERKELLKKKRPVQELLT